MRIFPLHAAASCPYVWIGYANPDAVTQIANGLSTTTYAYDNNGNLISAGTGSATTTYTYDYANRLIALFAGGATTTYRYDAFGQRVLQTGTSTTTIYPFKWYSVASSTGTGTKYATTTSYVFNGDTLLATVSVWSRKTPNVVAGSAPDEGGFLRDSERSLFAGNPATQRIDNAVPPASYPHLPKQSLPHRIGSNSLIPSKHRGCRPSLLPVIPRQSTTPRLLLLR